MNAGKKFQINFENNPRFKDSKFTKMVDSDLIKKQTEEFLAKGGEIINYLTMQMVGMKMS